ncbi:hypothetical protein SESBI_45113 [Sesbania bispinosa]|nr:hypothetical protein SESBI_45113 [Sesbania bispinosa]
MSGNEEWRKTADTHKMSGEQVKGAGVEGSSKRPAGVVGYSVLYTKKKPEASAVDVAKVSVGVAQPQDTRPRK